LRRQFIRDSPRPGMLCEFPEISEVQPNADPSIVAASITNRSEIELRKRRERYAHKNMAGDYEQLRMIDTGTFDGRSAKLDVTGLRRSEAFCARRELCQLEGAVHSVITDVMNEAP
jgi:hypothetical protein